MRHLETAASRSGAGRRRGRTSPGRRRFRRRVDVSYLTSQTTMTGRLRKVAPTPSSHLVDALRLHATEATRGRNDGAKTRRPRRRTARSRATSTSRRRRSRASGRDAKRSPRRCADEKRSDWPRWRSRASARWRGRARRRCSPRRSVARRSCRRSDWRTGRITRGAGSTDFETRSSSRRRVVPMTADDGRAEERERCELVPFS